MAFLFAAIFLCHCYSSLPTFFWLKSVDVNKRESHQYLFIFKLIFRLVENSNCNESHGLDELGGSNERTYEGVLEES